MCELTDSTEDNHAQSLRAKERDHDDLQNELAGRETGRQRRFLPGDHESNPRNQERRDRQTAAQMTALQALLTNDAAYRALYNETNDQLRLAEDATERALAKARQALDQAEAALDNMKDRANRLGNGTRVYRDAKGDVRREDGTRVAGSALDEIVWRVGAPDYESFVAQSEARQAAEDARDELTHYQVDVLGDARNRLSDQDNPVTADELHHIQDEIKSKMPKEALVELPHEQVTSAPAQATSSIPVPDLS